MNKEQIAKSKVALRFNTGKTRYSLLEPYAIEELAKIFTIGAIKYDSYNWLKGGMKTSTFIDSLKRHIAAFEKGEDIDPETGCHHMAHAAWNALGIVSYAHFFPEDDDRIIKKLNEKKSTKRTKKG